MNHLLDIFLFQTSQLSHFSKYLSRCTSFPQKFFTLYHSYLIHTYFLYVETIIYFARALPLRCVEMLLSSTWCFRASILSHYLPAGETLQLNSSWTYKHGQRYCRQSLNFSTLERLWGPILVSELWYWSSHFEWLSRFQTIEWMKWMKRVKDLSVHFFFLWMRRISFLGFD